MRPSTAIAWHRLSFWGVMAMSLLIVCSALYQDRARSSVRQEAAQKQRQDDEASRTAQAEVKKQVKIAQDAAAQAAAAKDEAAQIKARLAETACQQARDDAIQKATKAQSGAHKAVDDCKTQFGETLITFKTMREFCKPAYGRLDRARSQLADATSKSCGVDATGSIERAK